MTGAMQQSRRNTGVRGCSSMVEQQLPKLFTTAQNCAPLGKSSHLASVMNQTLRNCAQTEIAQIEKEEG